MNTSKRNCFVIMPFIPELHYFYLYIKEHVERHHGIECERADDQILTVPVLEKINDMIRNADVIVADCSDRNANVFYELGIAHAHGKKVVLITKDPVRDAPSDIRHYDFIKYELNKHVDFLNKLDNALHNVFVERYDRMYDRAIRTFRDFTTVMHLELHQVSKSAFLERVWAAEKMEEIPSEDDSSGAADAFLLSKILSESNDVNVMSQIGTWLMKDKLSSNS